MKTYDRVISDWSSDVCSSDLEGFGETALVDALLAQPVGAGTFEEAGVVGVIDHAAGIGLFPVDAHGNPERHGGVHRYRAPSVKGDRKSVVEGKSVQVRVDLGGRRNIKKKHQKQLTLST